MVSEDNGKLLQQLKSGFKRSVFWNEYLSKQDDVVVAIAGYDFLIDPSFQGANRLFVLPFPNEDDRVGRNYYMTARAVTNYNVMINEKSFLDQPVNSGSRRYNEQTHLTLGITLPEVSSITNTLETTTRS